MTPQALLSDLSHDGITPALTPDGTGIAVPAGRLNEAQRAAVVAHKAELIEYLLQASRLTSQALNLAMHACDQWGDSPAAREQMRCDVMATPPHLMADLLEHLQQTYSPAEALLLKPVPPADERGSSLEGCRTGNSDHAPSLHASALRGLK